MKLNMNSKGFYTALVSLIVVALISVTIIQLDSFNKQNQSKAFNDNAVDLQAYWNNARLVADKAASNIIGRNFKDYKCSNNFELNDEMKTGLDSVLLAMKENNKSCFIKDFPSPSEVTGTQQGPFIYTIELTLQCSNEIDTQKNTSLNYSNAFTIKKTLSFTNNLGSCQVKVSDFYSAPELTEFDSATAGAQTSTGSTGNSSSSTEGSTQVSPSEPFYSGLTPNTDIVFALNSSTPITDLYAIDLTLNYNSNELTFSEFKKENGFFKWDNIPQSLPNSPNKFLLTKLGTVNGDSGTGKILEIVFTVTGNQATSPSISSITLYNTSEPPNNIINPNTYTLTLQKQ